MECKDCGKKFEDKAPFQQHSEAKHKRKSAQVRHQPKKKPVNKLLLISVLVVAVLAAIYFNPFGGGSEKPVVSQPVDEGNYSTSKTKGDDSARVTIVEFSDFQCPACAVFYRNTLPLIESEYVSTGKVKVEYKHFPLSSHRQAALAALASECAREQGAFWKYHDTLFENQAALRESSYKVWAERLSLDVERFNRCYDDRKYMDDVRAESREGRAAGVSSTPSFLVNGRLIKGAWSFADFQRVIEVELQKDT